MARYLKNKFITIIGMGYVGLPLALEFGKKYNTLGYDISKNRISDLKKGKDKNKEHSYKNIKDSTKLKFTSSKKDLKKTDIFVITVPTPIKNNKKPDLSFIFNATKMVAKFLRNGSFVIYESTVYPGLTDNYAIPILESNSLLKLNKDFFCGYSPERVNPGDSKHNIKNITKVVSGSNKYALDVIDDLYKSIIPAGTHRTTSIATAEAAKVIENSQRDLNIAFVNELSIIFDKLKIDTQEVLNAASTKWNFIPFQPGLVGGHCIGVDPYYLTYVAKINGVNPKTILAGRSVNDLMGKTIVKRLIKNLRYKIEKNKNVRVLIMGLTFKENCTDIRNSQVIKIVDELSKSQINYDVYDPYVTSRDAVDEYGITPINKIKNSNYDAILIAVAHKKFKEIGIKKIRKMCKNDGIIFDIKRIFKKNEVDMVI